VTSRGTDALVERVAFDGRTLEDAAAMAETVLHDIVASAPRGGAPVIGYPIRDESGIVVRRLYKGLR
jgi:hypothetical protein